MRRQLELWPTSQGLSQPPKIWKTLTGQQKKDVITALADLFSKMVSKEKIDQNEDESHER